MKYWLHHFFIRFNNSSFIEYLSEVFDWLKFSLNVLINFPLIFRYRGETYKQIYILGNQALPLIVFASIFISMVMTLEWGNKLEPFGALTLIGRIIGLSVIREIGPMVTGIMMSARTGAKIVSEIGNMVLTEQVDALRAFGTDPIKRLIVPRVFAAVTVMIPLTIIASTMGVIAGWFSSVIWSNVDSEFYWLSIQQGIFLEDIIIGIVKPPAFGLLIGLLSSYFGYTIKGGAEGLGRAATRTVVFCSLSIFIVDFMITKIILTIT